jgi:hypothetical protein
MTLSTLEVLLMDYSGAVPMRHMYKAKEKIRKER